MSGQSGAQRTQGCCFLTRGHRRAQPSALEIRPREPVVSGGEALMIDKEVLKFPSHALSRRHRLGSQDACPRSARSAARGTAVRSREPTHSTSARHAAGGPGRLPVMSVFWSYVTHGQCSLGSGLLWAADARCAGSTAALCAPRGPPCRRGQPALGSFRIRSLPLMRGFSAHEMPFSSPGHRGPCC